MGSIQCFEDQKYVDTTVLCLHHLQMPCDLFMLDFTKTSISIHSLKRDKEKIHVVFGCNQYYTIMLYMSLKVWCSMEF